MLPSNFGTKLLPSVILSVVMILCCLAVLTALLPSGEEGTSIFLWASNCGSINALSDAADPTPTQDWACDPGLSNQSTVYFRRSDWFRDRHKTHSWVNPTLLVPSG